MTLDRRDDCTSWLEGTCSMTVCRDRMDAEVLLLTSRLREYLWLICSQHNL